MYQYQHSHTISNLHDDDYDNLTLDDDDEKFDGDDEKYNRVKIAAEDVTVKNLTAYDDINISSYRSIS